MAQQESFVGRVCFCRNQSSKLYFIDVITVHQDSSLNDWGLEFIELCIRGDDELVFTKESLEAIKVGDVLRVSGTVEAAMPRPPRHRIVKVTSLERSEPWSETFVSTKKPYAFPLPSFLEKWKTEVVPEAIQRGRPICILQCHLPLAERVAALFSGVVATTLTKDRLIYLYDDNEYSIQFVRDLEQGIMVPFFLHSIIQRIYLLTGSNPVASISLDETVDLIATRYKSEMGNPDSRHITEKAWNILTFPKELQKILLDRLLAKRDCKTDCPSPNGKGLLTEQRSLEYDSLLYIDGLYWTGFNVPRISVPEKPQATVPSSAYYKLLEIKDRYLNREGLFGRYVDRGLAVDIGASPGGWTYCLSKQFNTHKVVAVDPATHYHPLMTDLFESRAAEHWPMRGEDSLSRLKALGGPGIACWVCDMNHHAEATVELFKTALGEGLIDAEKGCLVVLTFKNTCKRKGEFHARKQACVEELSALPGVIDLQETHLFANTRNETTIVFQVYESSDYERCRWPATFKFWENEKNGDRE